MVGKGRRASRRRRSALPAATFDVTNTSDSGPGSFRQAVLDANLAPGPDTVSFAIDGTIRITGGAIAVAATVRPWLLRSAASAAQVTLTLSGRGEDGICRP